MDPLKAARVVVDAVPGVAAEPTCELQLPKQSPEPQRLDVPEAAPVMCGSALT